MSRIMTWCAVWMVLTGLAQCAERKSTPERLAEIVPKRSSAPRKCVYPPDRPVFRFPICGGLNNMVQATLNAVELAAKLDYYVCPPGVYHDFMHDRKKRRFGEMFDEDYFFDAIYKDRNVCGVKSLNGDSDRYCHGKKDVPVTSQAVFNRIHNGTLIDFLDGHGIRFLNCPFYMRLGNFSDAGWFRPSLPLMATVDSIRQKLDKEKTGHFIAAHLRVEGDFERHCTGKKPNCYRTVEQIAEIACKQLHLPCHDSTVYVMTGAPQDRYIPVLQKYFRKVVDKTMLLGRDLGLGRERMALLDMEVAREADYALVTLHSTFSQALDGERSRDGHPTLYYSHDRNILCLPGNRAHIEKMGFGYELPAPSLCFKEVLKKQKKKEGGKGEDAEESEEKEKGKKPS